VEETFLAPHVAHCRLGHDDALEPRRYLGPAFGRGADTGQTHEVAQRDHADQVALLDDGQMPVVVCRQAGPGAVHLFVRTEHVGMGGHPEPDAL
jgi:hypothetical protein